MDAQAVRVIAFILLCSCSNYAYVTKQGIGVFGVHSPVPARADLNLAVDLMLIDTPGRHKKLRDYLDGLDIAFEYGEPISGPGTRGIPCDAGSCSGLTYISSRQMELLNYPCLGNTALAHEFGHIIQQTRYGDPDVDHVNADFFIAGCDKIPVMFEACMTNTFEVRYSNLFRRVICNE